MGKTVSKESDVTSSGVVTSNFIVDEQRLSGVPLDVKILMYITTCCIVIITVVKLRKAYRRGLKRNISRSMYLRPPQPHAVEDS